MAIGKSINLDWTDLFLFIIAFIGLSGYLTEVIVSTAQSIKGLFDILVKRFNKALSEK